MRRGCAGPRCARCACRPAARATLRQLLLEPNRPCSTSSGGPLPTVSNAGSRPRCRAYFFFCGGRSVQWPSKTSAAMPIDSPSVGCGWIVLPMSAGSQPISIARRDLADQVAGMRADDAAADDAVGRLVEQQLGEALVAAVGDGAARSRPGEHRLADLDALRPCTAPRSCRPRPPRGRCRPPTGSGARRRTPPRHAPPRPPHAPRAPPCGPASAGRRCRRSRRCAARWCASACRRR